MSYPKLYTLILVSLNLIKNMISLHRGLSKSLKLNLNGQSPKPVDYGECSNIQLFLEQNF
ncbi:MAG: hypothetical protein ACJAX4_004880 [Clostridium sp.]|jgi:hypothetical protein